MSLYRSIANIPFRSFWLGTNVTLELFLFLGKFLANRLSSKLMHVFPIMNDGGVTQTFH